MPAFSPLRLVRKLVLPVLLGLAFYYAVFGGEYSLLDMQRVRRLRESEQAALDSLRREVDSIEARADSLQTDTIALERVARERYGMIRDGEVLYRFPEPTPDTTETDSLRRPPEPRPE